MSSKDLGNALGFKPNEIPKKGATEYKCYYSLMQYIWQRVQKKLTFFYPSEFEHLCCSSKEKTSNLQRMIDNGLLIVVYKIHCNECGNVIEETENPVPYLYKSFKCDLCEEDLQIYPENILVYYKFNDGYLSSLESFFFREIFRKAKPVAKPTYPY